MKTMLRALLALSVGVTTHSNIARAQDTLPRDNTGSDYHPSPNYRESESHPLRIVAYALHPIGWVAREFIFRPFSYFASSTPETRKVMGYREPFDFRRPSCFHASSGTPDCRQIKPFNYDANVGKAVSDASESSSKAAMYLPDTNFDFNKRTLNQVGKDKVKSAVEVLQREGALRVVLEGHTDARGSEAYNQKLGLDRAEAVKAELVSLGVPVESLSTVSFGESRPLFTEEEEWAYAANRRVHMRVEEQAGVAAELPQGDGAKPPVSVPAPQSENKPTAQTTTKATKPANKSEVKKSKKSSSAKVAPKSNESQVKGPAVEKQLPAKPQPAAKAPVGSTAPAAPTPVAPAPTAANQPAQPPVAAQ